MSTDLILALSWKAIEAAAQEGGSSSSKPSGPLSHANGGVNRMEVLGVDLPNRSEKKNQNEEDVL